MTMNESDDDDDAVDDAEDDAEDEDGWWEAGKPLVGCKGICVLIPTIDPPL